MSKSTFPLITTILAVIVLSVTAFLFFFLSTDPEKSTLFWVNLGYALFLELLFFVYIGFIRLRAGKPGLTAVFYPAAGNILVSYLIIGVAIMLAYNLWLCEKIPFNYYVAALIVITVIAIVLMGFILKADRHHQEVTAAETVNSLNVTGLKAGFETAGKQLKNTIAAKGLPAAESAAVADEIEKIVRAVRFLPHNTLEKAEHYQQLSGLLESVNRFAGQVETTTADQPGELSKSVSTFVRNSLDQLDAMKLATRK